MIKNFIIAKGKHGFMALSMLLAAPLSFTFAVEATVTMQDVSTPEESKLFNSLAKFLFRKRSDASLHEKKWADWCNEWIAILKTFEPALKTKYASLETDLTKVSRWKNGISIGSRLEKALAPYVNVIPKEILDRVAELGKDGMIELINASLKGTTPQVADSNLDFLLTLNTSTQD